MNNKGTKFNKIKIVDRPCGTGKTNTLLNSFKTDKKYLVVVPYLTEVARVLRDACVPFVEPLSIDNATKTEALVDHLIEGKNIVTTHQLYPRLPEIARKHLLDDYNIIIDEVLDVVEAGQQIKPDSYFDIYISHGYVQENQETGQVTPTKKWSECIEGTDDTLCKKFYEQANSGCLYRVDESFFLWAMPIEVLTSGQSLTVYTYLAAGSMFVGYLNKRGVSYKIDIDRELDEHFRKKAKNLLTVESIPSVEKFKFSASGQSSMTKVTQKKVSSALKNLRSRNINTVPLDSIAVTSLKSNWYQNGKSELDVCSPKAGGFSKTTGLLKSTNWLPNTTRGTNDYVHVSHMIYLWDQYINPYLLRWLAMDNFSGKAQDAYAISELVQWIYRSQIRKGLPVTVYIPSPRMRSLLESWLNGDDLTA